MVITMTKGVAKQCTVKDRQEILKALDNRSQKTPHPFPPKRDKCTFTLKSVTPKSFGRYDVLGTSVCPHRIENFSDEIPFDVQMVKRNGKFRLEGFTVPPRKVR